MYSIDLDVCNNREFQAEAVMDGHQSDINARVRIGSRKAAGAGGEGSVDSRYFL